MDDDRTPFEKEAKLEGQTLIDYRKAKAMFRLKDPELRKCPECGDMVMGQCVHCEKARQDQKAEQIRIWAENDRKRRGDTTAPGSLAAKVKNAEEKQIDPKRAGAECAYPDD